MGNKDTWTHDTCKCKVDKKTHFPYKWCPTCKCFVWLYNCNCNTQCCED